jgi:predicted membrane chloride channel (bestrophin family)
MRIDEGYKEILKWILGIVSAILLLSLKNSYDRQNETNKKLEDKVDKVYDFSISHEVRMVVIEEQIKEHKQKILDLQLAQERYTRQEQLSETITKANKELNGK